MLDDLEALYGGAAGGGKTDALIMGALQYVDVPGYAALILRRTWKDLSQEEAIMDRSIKWLENTDAEKREGGRKWIFPSGATLRFGHAQNYKEAKQQFSGPEFQYIGIDEVTQGWDKRTWQFLRTRLRGPHPDKRRFLRSAPDGMTLADVPVRLRGATNPGGTGHIWVKGRFITGDGNRDGRPLPFVSAKVRDNPHVNVEQYEQTLDIDDPVERARLLEGDWDIAEGNSMFSRSMFTRLLDERPNEEGLNWVRYWDMAGTEPKPGTDPDWTVGTLLTVRDGMWVVADVHRFRTEDDLIEAEIRATCYADHAKYGNRYEVVIEQEPGSAGKSLIGHYKRNVLPGLIVSEDKVSGNKALRAKPVKSAAAAGNIALVRGHWLELWLQELELFPHNCDHDDQVDSLSGALSWHPDNPGGEGGVVGSLIV